MCISHFSVVMRRTRTVVMCFGPISWMSEMRLLYVYNINIMG